MADETNKNSFGQTLGLLGTASGYGLAANALGNVVGSVFNDLAAQRAFERQKKMFDYVAEYNSPKNQVARLKQAGIAPATAFGGINSAQSAPSMNTGNFQANNSVDPFAFQQLRNLKAEEENLRSQAYKNQAEGDKAKSQTKGQNIENEWKPKVYENQIKLNDSLTSLNGASEEKVRQEIPMIVEQTKKIIQETSNLVEQSKFIGVQINKCNEEIKNLKKQRQVYSSQILLNQAYARKAQLEADYQEINNEIKRATKDDEIEYLSNRFETLADHYKNGQSELNSNDWNEFLSLRKTFPHYMRTYNNYVRFKRSNVPLNESVKGGVNFKILGQSFGWDLSRSFSHFPYEF